MSLVAFYQSPNSGSPSLAVRCVDRAELSRVNEHMHKEPFAVVEAPRLQRLLGVDLPEGRVRDGHEILKPAQNPAGFRVLRRVA